MWVVDRVGELELFHNCSCGTMDERLPQTIAEAFACKFPEWNAEKFTRRGESCKSVDIEDVDDLKIFTDAGLKKLDVSETVRSALRAVKQKTAKMVQLLRLINFLKMCSIRLPRK